EIESLIQCMEEAPADFIVVSNEVGAGIVPVNRLARVYSELLGQANQTVAAKADEIYLMVAGIPVRVKP
ncbi:MAG: cobinamide kinase, partial [Dehalococcoidia bacterium]|nr:cobinamide kinase [Dehalococcoidia bacterium]